MKVLILFNPKSGKDKGLKYANKFEEEFKTLGVETQSFSSASVEENFNFFKKIKKNNESFDCVLILGGDGTIGRTVNSMLKNDLNFPIATCPLGTANDFSWFVKMPKKVKKVAKCIAETKPIPCDVANVNGEYVINVVGGGLYTNGYTNYKTKNKKFWGKLAYYFKAIGESFKVRNQRFSINIDGEEIREDLCFFAVLNGSSAGGMNKLAKNADISDGKFDFVAFRKCNFFQRVGLFFEIVFGKQQKNKKYIHKQGRQFAIKTIHGTTRGYTHCDMDGDEGPKYPVHIKVCKHAIKVFTLNKKLLEKD